MSLPLSSYIPPTARRVPRRTSAKTSRRIRENTIGALNEADDHPEKIDQRLRQLETEWDIERALEANAALAILAGMALGMFVAKKWLILPAAVGGFLLQHALHGWCPPLPVFRRLGVRTQREIAEERMVLKARRGDFREVHRQSSREALKMAKI